MKEVRVVSLLLVGVCLLLAVSLPAQAQNWAHTWGGSQNDSANAVTTDASGNVYTVGSTNSFGAGGSDVLILKYDSAGNLQWQKTWGGPGNDYGNGVAVNGNGNVYVTGGTSSFGAGWFDVFVLKFDSTGNLLWSKTWGGGSYDVGYDISLDASGNVYVAAESYSVGNAAILLKYDPSGNLLWSRAWKGPATYDSAYSVAVDSGGNILETGISWDYSVSPEHNSILLLKYDSSGNLLWNRNWAGPSEDEAWASKAVEADQTGNVYVAGREAAQCASSPCNFGFLLFKVDPQGNFLWSSTWKGSAGFDSAGGLAFDGAGNPVITGVINAFGASPAAALLNYDTSGTLLASKAWFGNSPTFGHGLAIQGSFQIIAGTAPNNTGSWQSFIGTPGTEVGSLTSPSATVSSPTATTTSPAGTVTSPTGVDDSGGGGVDAWLAKTSFGFLDFPLAGKYPDSREGIFNCDPANSGNDCVAAISAVFDHDVNPDPSTGSPAFYSFNTKVKAYSGEEGVQKCGNAPCFDPVGKNQLMGYKNTSDNPYIVNGNYTGGSGCKNGPCGNFLFYTGHAGFDYPVALGTEIIAPADGLLFIPTDDSATFGEPVNIFHVMAIDHGNGYASWYLHIGCQAGTIDPHCSLNSGDFRGIDADGNVICSSSQLSSTGCLVKRGDVIGLVGNKGLKPSASYAHLHFELRKGLAETPGGLPKCLTTCLPVDPYGWTGGFSEDPYSQFLGGLPNTRLWR